MDEHTVAETSFQDLSTDSFLKEMGFDLTPAFQPAPDTTPMTPQRNPSPPPDVHFCPIHYPALLKRKSARNGWEYYTCSENDCFIFTDIKEIDKYSKAVEEQLHEHYREHFRVLQYMGYCNDLPKLQCYCHGKLRLSQSRSPQNENRLYLKCRQGKCDFFQWVDEQPKGRVKAWIQGEEHRGADWKSRGFEATPRHPSRDAEGYPKRGYVGVSARPPSPLSEPIPFDQELWDQCRNEEMWLMDNLANKIGFPREIQGHVYTETNEKELREKLYMLRVIAKHKRAAGMTG